MAQRRLAAAFTTQSPSCRPSSFPANKCVAPSCARHLRTALIAACIFAGLIVPGAPACAESSPRLAGATRFAAFVAEASRRFGIPVAWIRAVMRAESHGDVHATSPKGAMGLMQIMPETWAALRERYHLGTDPYDVHDNILAGAAYLRELHDRYGIPGFLAAYNAGPARWENHLAKGRPLPAATRAYLAKLAPIIGSSATNDTALLASIVRSRTEASLFPKRRSGTSNSMTAVDRLQQSGTSNINSPQDWTGLAPPSDGLFVALSSAGRSR